MIESVFQKQEQAIYSGRSEGANGELEIAKLETKAVKTNRHLVQEHERYLQHRRGKPSCQLARIDKVLALTPNHIKISDREYKIARNRYLEGQKVVDLSRAESFDFQESKQKAEQGCRAKEGQIESLDKAVEMLREELGAQKLHVAELENRYGV